MSVLALTGGVGGAKLALGLSQVLADEQLSIIVNTADDFKHLGLHISPDLDTLMYTLSGQSNQQQGWGIEGETWQVRDRLAEINAPTWFQLGDKDLATHLYRSHNLAEGQSLSSVTQCLFEQFGIAHKVLPMCDEKVSTFVETASGRMAFQDYFVAKQCEPEISACHFEGLKQASLSAGVECAIAACETIVLCPSNPFVSIQPILAVPGMFSALKQGAKPVVLVSPIVNGTAVKGPAAKMMAELGLEVSNKSVADFYHKQYPGLATHIVIDESDAQDADYLRSLGLEVLLTQTLMKTLDDKTRLAQQVLQFVGCSLSNQCYQEDAGNSVNERVDD